MPNSQTSRQTGDIGENQACEYLIKKGFRIIARNFTIRGGELDIVAQAGDGTVCFIEVKTRKGGAFGSGDEAITRQKILRIRTAMAHFLEKNPAWRTKPCRIDIIDIEQSSKASSIITHIEDIEV